MLNKVLMIRGIGLLHDALPKGHVELKKHSLLYGDNGRGKTTLTDIFRSLGSGDTENLLAQRRTLNGTNEPEVKFASNNTEYHLKDEKWSSTLPQIEVFDSAFVDENVYSGTEVKADHRKNLHKFALGQQGVKLSFKVDELNDQSRAKAAEIATAEYRVKAHIIGDCSLDAFLQLRNEADIDRIIEERKKALQAAEDSAAIALRPLLFPIHLPESRKNEVDSILQQSIDTLERDAEQCVTQHIKKKLDTRGEAWLESGTSYLKSTECPYCGQIITDTTLVDAYIGYFSTAYKTLKGSIGAETHAVKVDFADTRLSELQRVISQNDLGTEFWRKYVPASFPQSPWTNIESAWRDYCKYLETVLESKLAAPLEPIAFNPEQSRWWDGLKETVDAYSQAVTSTNEAIQKFKQSVQASGQKEAQDALNEVLNIKARWEEAVANLCKALLVMREEKSNLEKEKEKAKKALDDYTEAELGEHQKKINKILKDCGAGFRITKSKTGYAGGEPRYDYQLEVLECRVDLAPKKGCVGPCFGTALSDGDKRTLAFAFFIAKLDKDPGIADKIVVVDDPVCSMDIHRRRYTNERLVKIGERCKQLIILTHDQYFAKMYWEEIKRESPAVLRLYRDGNFTVIDKCDLDELCKSVFSHNLDTLYRYIDGGWSGDLLDVARCIRPYLEGVLRLQYPRELEKQKMLGEIINVIRNAKAGPLVKLQPHADELDALNKYCRKYHHDDSPQPVAPAVEEPELLGYARRAIRVAGEIHRLVG